MGDPTKAELAGELEKRIRTVELDVADVKSRAATTKSWISSVLVIWCTLLTLGGSLVTVGVFWGGTHILDNLKVVAVTAEKAAELKAGQLRLEGLVEKTEIRLTKRIEDLDKNLSRTSFPGERIYHEHVGKISRVGKDSLTFEERDGQIKTERTFPIAPGATVLIKGKGVSLQELRAGMNVVLLFKEDGVVQLIEQINEHKKKLSDIPPPPLDP